MYESDWDGPEAYDRDDPKHGDYADTVIAKADRDRDEQRIAVSPTVDMALVNKVLAGAWGAESRDHGENHWRAVAGTAVMLAKMTEGADVEVAFLFGLLHDTRRMNEFDDPRHGQRAAMYAEDILGDRLGMERMGVLYAAIRWHDNGGTSDDPTVGVCWDADRLQLPRVGITPDPDLFSTAAGRAAIPAYQYMSDWAPPPQWGWLTQHLT